MQRIIRNGIGLMLMAFLAAAGNGMVLVQENAATNVDFVRDIKPIFEQYCISCHGPEKEENFRIDDLDATLMYVEDAAETSDLYNVLISDDEEKLMPPPDEKNPLSKEQIELVKQWIESGAKWPDDLKWEVPVKVADPPVQVPDDPATTEALAPAGQARAPAPVTPAKSVGERIWLAIGPLHPAAVHLPIGLLLGAGLFALLGLRGNFVMSDCAYYCLWLGAITSVFAAVFGWSYAIHEHLDADFRNLFDTNEKIFLHRISGIGAALFAVLLALYASAARAADPDDGLLWKMGAIVLAIGVGFVGHSGGELTYGKNHYKELYELVDEYTGWNSSGVNENEEGGNKAFENQDPAKDEQSEIPSGQTSEETDNSKTPPIPGQQDPPGTDPPKTDSAGSGGSGTV